MKITLEDLEAVAARCETWPPHRSQEWGIVPGIDPEDLSLTDVLAPQNHQYG